MSALTFYTHPQSRGRIIRWMLEETGAPYETVVLDYASSMRDAAYLAVNPMGKVPAIVHHGKVVTECAAICAYLADAFPAAGLAPEPAQRADYYRWLFFASGPLEAAFTDKAMGLEPDEKQQRSAGYGTLERTIAVIEQGVAAHPFIAGDRFSAADVYVSSQIGFMILFKMLEERPVFTDYLGRTHSRPAFKRAGEIDDALIAQAAAS